MQVEKPKLDSQDELEDLALGIQMGLDAFIQYEEMSSNPKLKEILKEIVSVLQMQKINLIGHVQYLGYSIDEGKDMKLLFSEAMMKFKNMMISDEAELIDEAKKGMEKGIVAGYHFLYLNKNVAVETLRLVKQMVIDYTSLLDKLDSYVPANS